MGGCLNFAEILRHLGDTGDKGDIPHGQRLNDEATLRRQGATFEATEQATSAIVAPVAHLSPCRNPAPVAESSPFSPCSPNTGGILPQETEPAAASRWWLIHYPDRNPVKVASFPPATHAEILERHPDAIAAEPINLIALEPARACSTCSHRCRSGCCGEPVAAGLSGLEGVIRYHQQGGVGCPAWQAIIPDDRLP